MLSITQAAGLTIAIALTIVFILIGYHIILILQEIRTGLKKVNKIITEAGEITEAISMPVSALSSLLGGIKSGANLIKKHQSSDDEQE